MAPASVHGRTQHGTRPARLVRSRPSTKTKESKEAGDVATTPDVEEVRQKRAAYYSEPAIERRRATPLLGVRPSTKSKRRTETPTVPKSRSSEQKKKRKRTSSSAHKPDSHNADADGYVYDAALTPQEAGSARRSAGVQRKSKHTTSTSAREVPSIVDDELTPNDSISQVGLNPAPRRTKSNISRSSAQRNLGAARLATVSEQADEQKSPPKPSRQQRRSSSIFDSLLRRHSTAAIPTRPPRLVECLTCGSDDIPSTQTAKLSCTHRMCHDCLKRIFEMSVTDPAHMPPRCCTKDHIPLKHVEKLFDLKFKVLWNRKYQEYHTKNRIYCPTPKCGEWIKPSHISSSKGRKYAQCPRCSTKVCTLCNGKLHKSSDCPQDPEIAKLVAQAKEKGWQTCYSCHAMVELKEGCNHMTCRCLAEFCMICGSKWKSCECPWFNYRDLPDPDRLTNMRVPEEVRVVYQRVMDAAGIPVPPPNAAAAAPPPPPTPHARARPVSTYDEELAQRRRQERLDADLARRLQLGLILNPEDGEEAGRPRDRHREANIAAWGLDNDEAGLNDNFVTNAANVVMSAFGDATLGRRGDRESGRRRRARQTAQGSTDAGLAPNFLGDESVLGVGPSPRRFGR